MKQKIHRLFEKIGYTFLGWAQHNPSKLRDIRDDEFWDLYNLCKPYTMTSVERMYALFLAIKYVVEHQIPGDFVECGVWRGGSAMIIARMLRNRGILNRHIFLYDTFEGMSAPTTNDVDFSGRKADDLLRDNIANKETSVWCLADLTDVRKNMARTNFPQENIHYIKGKVEETIPATMPEGEIAVLRLDTDWYDSTRHELLYLFPKLAHSGVLLIDDYGHWEGCRKAVDEYLSEHSIPILLSRIDYTGRIAIKS